MKLRNGMKLPDWVKWVARDENYELWCFTDEPSKEGDVWKTEYGIGYCERLDDVDGIYNDIQWDDEKPTPVNKSLHKGGKTEIKKDIEWLKEEVKKLITEESQYMPHGEMVDLGLVLLTIDQLDEPEKPVIPKFAVKRGPEAGVISVAELNRITNAKAHGYDEVPTIDMVNRPKHYVGIDGLEVEPVLENFLPKIKDGYVAPRVGSLLEYVLRHPEKNGIEDLEKAEKNMRQVFTYLKNKG